jgi:hypothetical protein
MRRQYVSKLSDKNYVYGEITQARENSNRATYELVNFIKSHSDRMQKSLNLTGIKSGNPNAVLGMIQSLKTFEEGLEIATKRFSRRVDTEMRKTDKYYVVRIKTKTGYIKSEESESKLKAARTLRTRELQKNAVKSFNENSPRVYATKFAIAEKGLFSDGKYALDKFLGDTQKRLQAVSKIYNDMNFEVAQTKEKLNNDLKKSWLMLTSIKPNEYADFSNSANDMKNLDKLIRGHFDEIVKGLMFVRSNLEASVASANNSMHHVADFSQGLEFA